MHENADKLIDPERHQPLGRPHGLRARRWLTAGAAGTAAISVAGVLATGALAGPARAHRADPRQPIKLSVFSPGAGDRSGAGGVGFIVDLSLDATKTRYNHFLSAAAGYKPYFNDPSSATFHPGPDPGAPGLVVLLSTTVDKPGTPFQGPRTNLAGLFQINGVAKVDAGKAETWNTWQPGKPLFGTGRTTLTAYLVKGTAPTVVPTAGLHKLSNVVRVHFDIAR
jgi:hypothetical protein